MNLIVILLLLFSDGSSCTSSTPLADGTLNNQIRFIHPTAGAVSLPLLSKLSFTLSPMVRLHQMNVAPYTHFEVRHYNRIPLYKVKDGHIPPNTLLNFSHRKYRLLFEMHRDIDRLKKLNVHGSIEDLARAQVFVLRVRQFDGGRTWKTKMGDYHKFFPSTAEEMYNNYVDLRLFILALKELLRTPLTQFTHDNCQQTVELVMRKYDINRLLLSCSDPLTFRKNVLKLAHREALKTGFLSYIFDTNVSEDDLIDRLIVRIYTDSRAKWNFINGMIWYFEAVMRLQPEKASEVEEERKWLSEVINELKFRIKNGIERFLETIQPDFEPTVQLNDKDRRFMSSGMPIILASTKAPTRYFEKSMSHGEWLSYGDLQLGEFFDIIISRPHHCIRLVNWLKSISSSSSSSTGGAGVVKAAYLFQGKVYKCEYGLDWLYRMVTAMNGGNNNNIMNR